MAYTADRYEQLMNGERPDRLPSQEDKRVAERKGFANKEPGEAKAGNKPGMDEELQPGHTGHKGFGKKHGRSHSRRGSRK